MGAVTGKGLSDLIREEFGLRTTFFLMIALVLANLTNVIAEFAGIASSLELFHIAATSRFRWARSRSGCWWCKGNLPQRRKDLPGRVHRVRRLYHFRRFW